MEDFNKKESRQALTAELVEQKNYRELVPRPGTEDYQRLKENIARNGFDDASPIKVNEDMVVLDGHTRLQIARELGLEWVFVIIKDLPDHFAEKRYVIQTNLDQRHLNTPQRAELAVKLEEISQEEARERQRKAGEQIGKSNLKQYQKDKELSQVRNASQLVSTLTQAGDQGRVLVQSASEAKVSYGTAYKAKKIIKAAETDPEISEAWNQAKQDKATVNQVYRQVREKERKAREKHPGPCGVGDGLGRSQISEPPEIREEAGKVKKVKQWYELIPYPPVGPKIHEAWKKIYPDEPENARKKKRKKSQHKEPIEYTPLEQIMYWLYQMADQHDIPRETMDALVDFDPEILGIWDWFFRDCYSAEFGWWMTGFLIERMRKQQRAALPAEAPLPPDAKKLGPWALDYVHRAEPAELVREFLPDSAHLVYTDALAAPDRVDWLGEFAARVLTDGHYLCVYVDKRQLPEAMARLSAHGLTYFWTCMVARPEDNQETRVHELWRPLLIYRKGKAAAHWDWFADGVLEKRPTNRGMIRQLLKGLTYQGQLVVDPFVGSGVTGMAARSLNRRFLGFAADAEEVRAANQRISEIRLAENT